jgi:hypothetical protein
VSLAKGRGGGSMKYLKRAFHFAWFICVVIKEGINGYFKR